MRSTLFYGGLGACSPMKFLEFRTSEIASAGFSGIAQQTLIRRSPSLPDLLHHPCDVDIWYSCCLPPVHDLQYGGSRVACVGARGDIYKFEALSCTCSDNWYWITNICWYWLLTLYKHFCSLFNHQIFYLSVQCHSFIILRTIFSSNLV